MPSVTPEDLTAQLALLDLGDRATLVVGSQPGAHLQTLVDRGAHVLGTPPLQQRHTAALLARHGVLRDLRAVGFADDHAATVEAVHRQAAGNPLYVGFLGREVIQRLKAGEARAPSEIIKSVTGAHGDLEAYYCHLLATAVKAPDEGVLAEHLALLDFPLTVAELLEIVPMLGRPRIERVIDALRPILDDIGTQGGLRIHHESFRRFIVERLHAEGRPLRALLDPIIAWLDSRGLFRDERAFRSLLPLLRRAARDEELLERIGPDFVSRSVIELQPHAAIEANLRLGAGVAADATDFSALARIAELRAAATTTFLERLSEPTTWAQAVIELDGAERLAERLLYDGRPTWPRESGLRLCAVVDRGGAAAPWREYLAMPRENPAQSRMPEQDERYGLDELRGMLRVVPWEDAIDRVARWIEGHPDASGRFFGGIAEELADVHGPGAIIATLDAASGASEAACRWLQLGLAEALAADGETERAMIAGRRAIGAALPCSAARRLLDIGMPPDELAATCADPEDLLDRLTSGRDPDHDAVDAFLSSVLVAAGSGTAMTKTRAGLSGVGFYRAWLRFCCDLADARAGRGSIVDALEELSQHDEPFAGRPRACDLYNIHDITVESFRRAAELVEDAAWPRALDLVLAITAHTTTTLRNHPHGPLTVWALLDLLLPYADRVPLDAVHRELDWTWRNQFYDFHAEASLRIARLERRAGSADRTDTALAAAGRCLAAYGFHKDVTVFGLIEALEAITDPALRAPVTDRFRRLFPLCDRAYRHSDGRETSHAASACFAAFASHSPGAAAESLARTFLEDPPARYELNELALAAVLASAADAVPPHLHHVLWRCCPAADVTDWLKAIDRLAATDHERACEAFAELAAAADGDTEAPAPEVARIVRAFAADRGWPQPTMDCVPDRRRQPDAPQYDASGSGSKGQSGTDADGGKSSAAKAPYFAGANTALKLLVMLRRRRLTGVDDDVDAEAFADELIARLRQLASDDSDTVLGLMEAFCHEQRFLDARGDVLARVAAAYAPDPPTAAELYVLAWIGTRDGWDPFGGLRHRGLLDRAFALDSGAALRRLAREFAWHIQTASYGITRRAAEAVIMAGRPGEAIACWDQAAAVVEHRLPVTGAERASFAAPSADLNEAGTERAYAQLLGALVHSSDPERRSLALAGIAELLPSAPNLAAAAIQSVLRTDASFTDTLLVVRLLELAAPNGNVPAELAEYLPGLAAAPGFGLHSAAGALLERRGGTRPLHRSAIPGAANALPDSKIDEALIWDARHRAERLAAFGRRLRGSSRAGTGTCSMLTAKARWPSSSARPRRNSRAANLGYRPGYCTAGRPNSWRSPSTTRQMVSCRSWRHRAGGPVTKTSSSTNS